MSSSAPPPTTDNDGGEKSARELEKERKKQEKLKKLEEKKAKQQAATAKAPTEKVKTKVIAEIPNFVDATKAGEKKILVDLDNASLKAYNPLAVESSHYSWWEKLGIYKPELDADSKTKSEGSFVIIEPPPNVTGQLHMGHALSGTLQDIMVRYNRMKGKSVLWLPGVDHAGISTQTVVEKMLMREKKQTRHDVGREKFLDIAMEWKETYHKKISATKKQMGSSLDWSREAFTMDEPRREAVSEAFLRLYEDGTIYRANRIINWDVQLRTAVSNLEVENLELKGRTKLTVPGYDKKIDFGVMTYFQYEIDGSDEKLEIATTRPETLLGDTGVAVNPSDPRYQKYIGKFVKHPFLDRLLPIVGDEHVDREFGSGVVKITPAHDQNDFAIGKRHNLDFINIFNDDGTLNASTGSFQGQKRYEARYTVVAALKEKGLFVKEEDNAMVLKLSERTKDVIEPILKPQWWMRMKDLAAKAVEVVKDGQITIFPASEEKKYFRWMADIDDWCLSRQLWWGHRVPAYYVLFDENPSPFGSDDDLWVAGRSQEEAQKNAEAKFPGKSFKLEQDPDVFDTWFSSGLWPFTTLGWPKQTTDIANFFPTSVLMTGWDILFFWAARMIMLSLKLTGQVPFREVYCHPIVRDSEGRKMSKSLGNVIDPFDVIHGISLEDLHAKLKTGNLDPKELIRATKYQKVAFPDGIPQCGTDALRFSLAAYSTGVTDIDFDIKVIFAWRKFCNKIYQAAKYLIKSLEGDFVPAATAAKTGKETLAERWILHKLTNTAKDMNAALEKKEFGRATTLIHQYWLHDLCDVFIEQSKYTLSNGTAEEKLSLQGTLYTAFDGALTMIHPFMPFLTEELWQRIPRRTGDSTESVSVARFPSYDANLDDTSAEADYELILKVCGAVRSLVAAYPITTETQLFCKLQDDANLAVIEEQIGSVKSLSGKGVGSIKTLSKEDSNPSGCVAYNVSSKVAVFLHVQGHVDLDAEIKKANLKLSKASEGVQRSQKLLGDSEYLSKVDEKIADGERAKLADYETEVSNTKDIISQFENLKLA